MLEASTLSVGNTKKVSGNHILWMERLPHLWNATYCCESWAEWAGALPWWICYLLDSSFCICIMELSQHLVIEMLVGSVTLWDMFMVHSTLMIRENSQHHLCFAAHFVCFSWLWWMGFPVWLPLIFWVITIGLCFITSNDIFSSFH